MDFKRTMALQADQIEKDMKSLSNCKSEHEFTEAMRRIGASLDQLNAKAKQIAGNVQSTEEQLHVLDYTKNIITACQQALIAGKEALSYDPFKSTTDSQYTSQVMQLAVKVACVNE